MKGFIVLYNENNKKILEENLLKLPLKEDYIISKSKELYSEEEPCIIYRTAIINKTGLEMLKIIEEKNMFNEKIEYREFKKLFGDVLDVPEEILFINFI